MLAGPTGLHHQDQKLVFKDKERDSKSFSRYFRGEGPIENCVNGRPSQTRKVILGDDKHDDEDGEGGEIYF